MTAPAFDADDPDTTTADIVQQRRKTRRGFVEKTEVQDDRFSGEEAARAGDLIVETFQPEGRGASGDRTSARKERPRARMRMGACEEAVETGSGIVKIVGPVSGSR